MSQKSKLLLGVVLVFFVLLFLISRRVILFPSDILNYFPLFSSSGWQSPHNSLLADPVFQFEPWRHYAKTLMKNGELPLWNTLSGMGTPFLANPQTALFFPVQMLYYLLPISVSLLVMPLLKLVFAGYFCFLYLYTIQKNRNAAILGTVALVFSSFFMSWLLWPHTNVYLMFPFLLYCIEKVHETKLKTIWYCAFSVAVGISFFGGHPETFFLTNIVVLLYGIFRLYRKKIALIKLLAFWLVGLALSGIQLVPFIEYLSVSTAWAERGGEKLSLLPLVSSVQFIFPYILGAPQTAFYKSFANTNFQESTGGYVGAIVAVLGVSQFLKKRLDTLTLFWGSVCIVSFLVAYGVFPTHLLERVFLLSQNANQRFVVITGFSLIVLATIKLSAYFTHDIRLTRRTFQSLLIILGMLCILPFFVADALRFLKFSVPEGFIGFLQLHIAQQCFTIVVFMLALLLLKKRRRLQFGVLLTCLLIETAGQFWDYNSFTSTRNYYPENSIITSLQSLPQGELLEVGNPSLKADSNIIYGLPSIQSYDALGVNRTDQLFRRLFPDRNLWGNPDSVSTNALDSFGVSYLLSDYDLRLTRQRVIPSFSDRLPAVSASNRYSIEFTPTGSDLRGVRLFTANFNRLNTCVFEISVLQAERVLASSRVECREVRDRMYLYVPIKPTQLVIGERYVIRITSNGVKGNQIALWGDSSPFLELYYLPRTGSHSPFALIKRVNATYLFEYPEGKQITYSGNYVLRSNNASEMVLLTSSMKDSDMTIRITNYPGWQVSVDGARVGLDQSSAFLHISVPSGNHLVAIRFAPLSVLLGGLLSGLTLLLLFIISLRSLVHGRWGKKMHSRWKKFLISRQEISSVEHCYVFGIGFVSSLILYLTMIAVWKPRFIMSSSSVINWFTVHGYPRQQDYFYFVTLFSFSVLFSTVVWFVWIWKKIK